jgi:hypothetical protein
VARAMDGARSSQLRTTGRRGFGMRRAIGKEIVVRHGRKDAKRADKAHPLSPAGMVGRHDPTSTGTDKGIARNNGDTSRKFRGLGYSPSSSSVDSRFTKSSIALRKAGCLIFTKARIKSKSLLGRGRKRVSSLAPLSLIGVTVSNAV